MHMRKCVSCGDNQTESYKTCLGELGGICRCLLLEMQSQGLSAFNWAVFPEPGRWNASMPGRIKANTASTENQRRVLSRTTGTGGGGEYS